MRYIVAISILAASFGAQAQAVRCTAADGTVTYQATPCDGAQVAATVVKAPPPPTPPKPADPKDAAQCRAHLQRTLKDAESARFDPDVKDIGVLKWFGASGEMPGRAIAFNVNAKNSYGGYTGWKLMVCYLSLDRATVLGVNEH